MSQRPPHLSLKVDDDLKRRVIEAAAAEDRSVSSWVRRAVVRQLQVTAFRYGRGPAGEREEA